MYKRMFNTPGTCVHGSGSVVIVIGDKVEVEVVDWYEEPFLMFLCSIQLCTVYGLPSLTLSLVSIGLPTFKRRTNKTNHIDRGSLASRLAFFVPRPSKDTRRCAGQQFTRHTVPRRAHGSHGRVQFLRRRVHTYFTVRQYRAAHGRDQAVLFNARVQQSQSDGIESSRQRTAIVVQHLHGAIQCGLWKTGQGHHVPQRLRQQTLPFHT